MEKFPNAETGEYNANCCRFPKNCSPYGRVEAYQAGNLSENDLEPPRDMRFPDRPLVVETKTLQQLRVGSSFRIRTELINDDALAFEMKAQGVKLEAFVLQEHLADDHYEEILEVTQPKTWWDHFKIDHLDSWWGRWLNTHFPPEYDSQLHLVRVKVERYANYPEADIEIPGLGRPVPYEKLRRLTAEEVLHQQHLKRLENEHDENKKLVTTYLVVPETFDDLSKDTGLPKEHFENIYRYDRDFDLVSKVYIIPDGFAE